jgi:Protoporphyrinogen oxidase
VNELWDEIMGDEFLLRPRMSRIYWNNRYLDYPLRGPDVIKKLGPVELIRCTASYARAAAKRNKVDNSLEDWVTNRFGRRLFELFFKTYNEKVWGAPASEIRAEWAASGSRGSPSSRPPAGRLLGNKGNKVKSLISEFNYPRYGPGQMWEKMADAIVEQGGEVRLEAPVERIELVGSRVVEVEAGGELYELPDTVISSLPLREVVEMVHPHAPREVLDAARGLRYRDFLTVALVVDGEDLFPDNWIYIHEPKVQVGRIQNYRSWSPWMVPDPSKACVGLEYFCFAGDELWTMSDDELVELAATELEALGLSTRAKVDRGFVTRVPKAYPIYDSNYDGRVQTIRAWLTGSRTSSRSVATGCTATTTRTTRC